MRLWREDWLPPARKFSTFAAKVFTTPNISRAWSVVGDRLNFTYAVPTQHLLHVWGSWVVHLLNDEVEPLRLMSPDLKAVMRRLVVVYVDVVWGDVKTSAAPALTNSWEQRQAALAEMDSDDDP